MAPRKAMTHMARSARMRTSSRTARHNAASDEKRLANDVQGEVGGIPDDDDPRIDARVSDQSCLRGARVFPEAATVASIRSAALWTKSERWAYPDRRAPWLRITCIGCGRPRPARRRYSR